MKTRNSNPLVAAAKTLFLVLLLLSLAPAALHAQLVADGGTTNITTAINLPGDLTVGTNAGNTTLNIIAPGAVTNALGFIGFTNTLSVSNQVTVQKTNAVWRNTGNLFIGTNSAFNSLVISDGGWVFSTNAFLGYSAGGRSNQVTVTGAGSLWSNRWHLGIGEGGSFNSMLIANGGKVVGIDGFIGNFPGASNNQVTVTGPNSVWTNSDYLVVGEFGSFNTLLITNGGTVWNASSFIGEQGLASNNQVIVTGSGSLWRHTDNLTVGQSGSGNLLAVSNGAAVANNLYLGRFGGGNNRLIISAGTVVVTNGSFIGGFGSNNLIVVTGAGSLWTNGFFLSLGIEGPGNQLVVSNAGTVVTRIFAVGLVSPSINNRVTVDGGTVRARESYEIRRGTNVFNAGLIEAGDQFMIGGAGFFEFNGGTLAATNSTVNTPFVVGNGVSAATNQLRGNGTHIFNAGLTLNNNARLTGNGTIIGPLTVKPGGSVAPGNSIGGLFLNTSPALNGALLLELSKPNASTFTNDQIQVAGLLTYSGSLTVTHLGPTALAAGDVASLFDAPGYAGAFTSLSLPALDPGLMWTNRLLVNGSFAVVVQSPPAISGATQSGTNLLFNVTGGSPGGAFTVLTSTNVALPRSSWTTNSTGNFDWLGNVTLTNGINAATPQRFFTVRAP